MLWGYIRITKRYPKESKKSSEDERPNHDPEWLQRSERWIQKQCQFLWRENKYGTIEDLHAAVLKHVSILKHVTPSYPKNKYKTTYRHTVGSFIRLRSHNFGYTLRTKKFPLPVPRALTVPFFEHLPNCVPLCCAVHAVQFKREYKGNRRDLNYVWKTDADLIDTLSFKAL